MQLVDVVHRTLFRKSTIHSEPQHGSKLAVCVIVCDWYGKNVAATTFNDVEFVAHREPCAETPRRR